MSSHCQCCGNELIARTIGHNNIYRWYCRRCRCYWIYSVEECEAMAVLDGGEE